MTTIALSVAIGVFFTLVGCFLASFKFKHIRREFGVQSEIKARRALRKKILVCTSISLIMQICIHLFKKNQISERLLIFALIINLIAIPSYFALMAGYMLYKIDPRDD